MWVGVSTQNERIKGGEIVDLVIGTASGIDELNKLGHLVSGVAMTRSGFGAAVAFGAPSPDISSAEALKRALLASKSIALSAAGPSGVYLSGLFQDPRQLIPQLIGRLGFYGELAAEQLSVDLEKW